MLPESAANSKYTIGADEPSMYTTYPASGGYPDADLDHIFLSAGFVKDNQNMKLYTKKSGTYKPSEWTARRKYVVGSIALNEKNGVPYVAMSPHTAKTEDRSKDNSMSKSLWKLYYQIWHSGWQYVVGDIVQNTLKGIMHHYRCRISHTASSGWFYANPEGDRYRETLRLWIEVKEQDVPLIELSDHSIVYINFPNINA